MNMAQDWLRNNVTETYDQLVKIGIDEGRLLGGDAVFYWSPVVIFIGDMPQSDLDVYDIGFDKEADLALNAGGSVIATPIDYAEINGTTECMVDDGWNQITGYNGFRSDDKWGVLHYLDKCGSIYDGDVPITDKTLQSKILAYWTTEDMADYMEDPANATLEEIQDAVDAANEEVDEDREKLRAVFKRRAGMSIKFGFDDGSYAEVEVNTSKPNTFI